MLGGQQDRLSPDKCLQCNRIRPRLRLVPTLGCRAGAHGSWPLTKHNSIKGIGVIDFMSPSRACSQLAL